MGANDAAEMLAVAQDECIRLEQVNADMAAQLKQLEQTPDPVEVLRALAEYRAEYSGPECALQASTLRHAADIIEGKGEAWGILPSWRWEAFSARFPTLIIMPVGDGA